MTGTRVSELLPEEAQIVDTVLRFVQKDIRPHVARYEREGLYPEDLVTKMQELGLFGIAVPAEHGGLGLRVPVFARILEELAKGWTAAAAYLNSHSTVAYLIATYGSHQQQGQYLPEMASGKIRAALCLTESEAGSDLKGICTTAVTDDAGYRVKGSKIFVTNGDRASLLLVLAKMDPEAGGKKGMSLMLVPKMSLGVKVVSTFQKMAFATVDTVAIDFENVLLGREALLGSQPGRGLPQLFDGLEIGRIAIAASAIGLAASALGEARRYAADRKAFGVSIDQHQAIQLRLAEMATKLVAARLLTQEAAARKDTGQRTDMLSAMAKLEASEACARIVADAMRIHGGYGYIVDFAIERFYREAPLYLLGEGTNDIQKLVIARRMAEGEGVDILGLPE